MFFKGVYNPGAKFPAVPLSDGAGEIIAVGDRVSRWKIGDRVCPIFMQGWLEGALTPQKARTSLGGGNFDGVLREYAVFDESGLVRIPDHLSYEEAADLTMRRGDRLACAGGFGRIKAGDDRSRPGHGRGFHLCPSVREDARRSAHRDFE